MHRYRMIALDIDGTLLDSRGDISPRLQLAVKRAAHSGVAVTLATGRTWRSALPVAAALGIDEPLVVNNGALVRAPGASLALAYHPLDRQIAVTAVQLLTRLGFAPLVSTCDSDGPNLFYEQKPSHPKSSLILGQRPQDVRQVFELAGLVAAITPMKVMALDRTESITQLAERLRREFREQVDVIVTQESPGFALAEVAPAGVHKATGLARLAQLYHIHPNEVIAFGDNFNDLEMLQWAGLGVAMGNAPDAVKSKADAVTATNDEDGVASFLERLGFRVA